MGKSLDQVFAEAKDGDIVDVTIVTNQDNGIVSYAAGVLVYHQQLVNVNIGSPFIRPARLSTTGTEPLKYFFSDRRLDIEPPLPPGTSLPPGAIGIPARQPFSANAVDKLGVSITRNSFGPPVIKFTLHSWGNVTFGVSMAAQGNLLVGVGPAIGGQTDHAVYVVAFTGIVTPQRPH